jgi:hypothetical protein
VGSGSTGNGESAGGALLLAGDVDAAGGAAFGSAAVAVGDAVA